MSLLSKVDLWVRGLVFSNKKRLAACGEPFFVGNQIPKKQQRASYRRGCDAEICHHQLLFMKLIFFIV